MTTPRASTLDAAVSELNDAAVTDTPASSLPVSTECVRSPGHPCNPPRPTSPVVEAPKTIDANVIGHDPRPEGMSFTALLPEGDFEVTSKHTGMFVDSAGQLIRGTGFSIRSIRKRAIVCVIAGLYRLPSQRVRFFAPGERP